MLTFFRRIRKTLLGSGATSKYLVYAIGEVLLVMVGILLALQVNNWNEERIKGNQIKSHLANLSSSLKADSSMFKDSEEVNAFRFHSFEYLLEKADQSYRVLPSIPKSENTFIWSGSYPDTLDRDFIRKSCNWFTSGFTNISIDRSAINEINNLGLFSEIKNDHLKKKIRDYYLFINWQFSDPEMQMKNKLQYEFHDYLRDNFGILATDISNLDDPMGFIRNDTGIIFRLKELREAVNKHCRDVIKGSNLAHEVVEMINSEIAQ